MYCPTCGYQLQELDVSTHSSGKFMVDHCGRCGGTWFDPFEINRLPYHEVARLAKLTVLPVRLSSILKTNLCPSCQTELDLFRPGHMPGKLKMHRCPGCKGIWATQRELEIFAENEEKETNYHTGTSIYPSLSVSFLTLIFGALFLASTLLTVKGINEAKRMESKASEAIGNIALKSYPPDTAIVTFQTDKAYRSQIEYGTSLYSLKGVTVSSEFNTNHGVILRNLKPSASYYYRIVLTDEMGNRIRSQVYMFEMGE